MIDINIAPISEKHHVNHYLKVPITRWLSAHLDKNIRRIKLKTFWDFPFCRVCALLIFKLPITTIFTRILKNVLAVNTGHICNSINLIKYGIIKNVIAMVRQAKLTEL